MSKTGKKIRVPSSTVNLVMMLGKILREHIKLFITNTECWTFENAAYWETRWKNPGPEADEREWFEYNQYGNPEHRMNLYLGWGKCSVLIGGGTSSATIQTLNMRFRCKYSTWVAIAQTVVDVQIWLQSKDGTVTAYHFSSDPEGKNIYMDDAEMPKLPPSRLGFTRPEPGEIRSEIDDHEPRHTP